MLLYITLSVQVHTLPADASQGEVMNVVRNLNENSSIDGILIQLPVSIKYSFYMYALIL
jgi:5,10-methylene-tetrahydrofolate dehydrogenase/methenyl tetrahydrofolate cyclohydrolase